MDYYIVTLHGIRQERDILHVTSNNVETRIVQVMLVMPLAAG